MVSNTFYITLHKSVVTCLKYWRSRPQSRSRKHVETPLDIEVPSLVEGVQRCAGCVASKTLQRLPVRSGRHTRASYLRTKTGFVRALGCLFYQLFDSKPCRCCCCRSGLLLACLHTWFAAQRIPVVAEWSNGLLEMAPARPLEF